MKYYVDAEGNYLGGWDNGKQPSGAIEVPFAPEDAQQAWDGGAWIWPLADAIAAKLAALDLYRWEQEIAGVAFGGGTIRTDPNSQAKVTAAYAMAKLDPAYAIPTWEVVPGVFMPLDNATIVAMGEAVRDHVQDTFNRKAVLHAQIAALETVEAVAAYDIAAAWADQ